MFRMPYLKISIGLFGKMESEREIVNQKKKNPCHSAHSPFSPSLSIIIILLFINPWIFQLPFALYLGLIHSLFWLKRNNQIQWDEFNDDNDTHRNQRLIDDI